SYVIKAWLSLAPPPRLSNAREVSTLEVRHRQAPVEPRLTLRRRMTARLEERGSYPTWVLVATLTGVFATSFPITILTISLSSMAEEFGARETTMGWVVCGPVLLLAVGLPVLGKLRGLF